MNAILDELVSVMAVKTAQEAGLASLEGFFNIFLLSVSPLLNRLRIPVVSLKVVDVHFFDDFELLVHAVVGHQAFQSLELVINNGRRDRRVVLVVPLMRELRPQGNHENLAGQHEQQDRNVGQIADEHPHDDVHDAVRDHRAQRLRVNNVSHRSNMNLEAAIKVRQQVVNDYVQANNKPVALAIKVNRIHLMPVVNHPCNSKRYTNHNDVDQLDKPHHCPVGGAPAPVLVCLVSTRIIVGNAFALFGAAIPLLFLFVVRVSHMFSPDFLQKPIAILLYYST